MMHVLSGQEISAKHLFHHQNVLKDVASVACPRVLWYPEHQVPALVPRLPALPVAVCGPFLGAAGSARGGLLALPRPARAEIVRENVRPARRAPQVPA